MNLTKAHLETVLERIAELDQRVRRDLDRAREKHQQSIRLINELRQRVGSLEASNAKLREEIRKNKEYRLVPLEDQ